MEQLFRRLPSFTIFDSKKLKIQLQG